VLNVVVLHELHLVKLQEEKKKKEEKRRKK